MSSLKILSLICRVSQPCTSVRCSTHSAARCCQCEVDSCWLQWPSSDRGHICPIQSVWSTDHLPADWWWHSGPVLQHHYPAQPDPVCVEGGGVQWPLLAGCGRTSWRHNRHIWNRWTEVSEMSKCLTLLPFLLWGCRLCIRCPYPLHFDGVLFNVSTF